MVPGHKLGFRLGQVKGEPVGLGNAGNDEYHEARKLRDTEPQVPLCLHDVTEAERAREHDDTQQRSPMNTS